jgi:L-amino acid N-acyltransferase YncA
MESSGAIYDNCSEVSAYIDPTSSGKMKQNDDVDRYIDIARRRGKVKM